MRSSVWIAGLLAAALAAPAAAQEPPTVVSGPEGRQSANVTVYNNNLAVVRETRRVELPAGTLVLRYADVAKQVRPETVYIRDAQDANALRVLEQNFRYDLLTPSRLMELAVGQDLTLLRRNPGTGEDEPVRAELVSTGSMPSTPYAYGGYFGGGYGYGGYYGGGYANPYDAVWRTDEGLTWGDVGRPVFPEVPEDFVARPTLEWLLEAPRGGARTLETTYLTWGMGWNADYVLVLTDDEKQADLAGWVTLSNDAGITLRNARLQLVAGDVAIQQPYVDYSVYSRGDFGLYGVGAGGGGFSEQGMFEYHLYTLERPTDLADREQKQLQLLSADDVPMEKKYRLRGQSYYFVGQYGSPIQNLQVDVCVEFQNARTGGLGIALPAGVIRVYKADSAGAQQFVGEDRIEHTAREERVKLRLGNAFDIAAERRQTDYDVLSGNLYETEWEVKLRNRKTETVVVEVLEPMAGDWDIRSSSVPFVKESARLVRFDVTCPPDEEIVLTYRVRTRY
ncbi:MAG: DUF4139 domain-containing protein [Deltaproteobacteria bacterium]|nr:DUF4139 domain-containing protein [Deltaproteobacteria bacterium]